jgi:hypothetical protein
VVSTDFVPLGAKLRPYDAFEPKRFVGYYEAVSPFSGVMLVRASVTR